VRNACGDFVPGKMSQLTEQLSGSQRPYVSRRMGRAYIIHEFDAEEHSVRSDRRHNPTRAKTMSSITHSTLHSALILTFGVLATAGCGSPSGLSNWDICAGTKVSRLQIMPKALNLRVGSTETLQVTMYDATGEGMIMCRPAAAWSSSDPSVATVSDGSVSGIRAGKVVIRVSAGGVSDTTSVTVVPTTIASIIIQRAPGWLPVGRTAGLTLVTRDSDGNAITRSRSPRARTT